MSISFGTEGWRAIIADDFTVDNVRLVTQAIAEHMLETAQGTHPVAMAVGYDTRFLSDYFAKVACEVLAGNQIQSILSDRAIPTCAVSRYVVDKHLPGGIVITASHNPGIYNGLKVKERYGGSATPETVSSIENHLGKSQIKRAPFEESLKDNLISMDNMLPLFLQGIKSFVDLSAIRRCGLRVIVDSMHGTGNCLIEKLLAGGRCSVETIHAQPDPLFGGQSPEPIASHLSELRSEIKRRGADIGIANDGDADRLGILGPDGVWLNPGQVMCILLLHLVKTRHAKGAVVKTVSNTMLINRVADDLGMKLIEVPVGFKHVAKLMLEDEVLIGGEESGGIGIKGYLPERDGIATGLLVLEAMALRSQKLSKIIGNIERRYGKWFYGREDYHLSMPQVESLFRTLETSTPENVAGVPIVKVNRLDGVKLIGRDESWLLFRKSGTEPIVRIYAETPTKSKLPKLLSFGKHLIP